MGGPNHKNNFCNSPMMINKSNTDYMKNLSFYYIAHFSKFIQPGAVRIGHSKYTNKLEVSTFKNFDNSIVVVLLNPNDFDLSYVLRLDKKITKKDKIKAHSIATLKLER